VEGRLLAMSPITSALWSLYYLFQLWLWKKL
jgi:hypothetical protein